MDFDDDIGFFGLPPLNDPPSSSLSSSSKKTKKKKSDYSKSTNHVVKKKRNNTVHHNHKQTKNVIANMRVRNRLHINNHTNTTSSSCSRSHIGERNCGSDSDDEMALTQLLQSSTKCKKNGSSTSIGQ